MACRFLGATRPPALLESAHLAAFCRPQGMCHKHVREEHDVHHHGDADRRYDRVSRTVRGIARLAAPLSQLRCPERIGPSSRASTRLSPSKPRSLHIIYVVRLQTQPSALGASLPFGGAPQSLRFDHFATQIQERTACLSRGHCHGVRPLHRDSFRTDHDPLDHYRNDHAPLT